jgi:penicillin amidase/acyl-homoserine-lactone acylase
VVWNANSSPFEVTIGADNPDPARYPEDLGIERFPTNRSRRLFELLADDAAISREEFDRVKFDLAYSRRSHLARRVDTIVSGPPPEAPALRDAVQALARWDLRANPENVHAALALLALRPRHDDRFPPADRGDLLRALEKAAELLRRHYGRTDVPWGEVLRLRRGGIDLALGGGPDLLRAVYSREEKDGRRAGIAGDSYILHVEWDTEGRVRSRSIHPFGSATLDARSPHYADQAPLFARGEWKTVWLEEAELRAHLKREYRPGQVER